MKFYLVIPLIFTMTAGAMPVPHIVVDRQQWNFGAVTNQFAVEHEFLIQNTGDAALQIKQVLSSCTTCLFAGIDRTNLAPGTRAVVRTHLDLSQASGSILRVVLIESNDPQTPYLGLELTGVSVPAYRLNPPDIKLDMARGGTVARVKIISLLKLHAPFTKASCENTNLEVKLSSDDDGASVIEVKPLASLPHGDIFSEVEVTSTSSNDLPCWVACSIHNPADLELIPPQLKLQAQDEPQRRILWIRQWGLSPLILLDILSSTDSIKCEIVPDSQRFNYRVNVAAWGQKNNSGRTNWLTLKMRDKDSQERLVPVPVLVN
jgi:hypothetical protein